MILEQTAAPEKQRYASFLQTPFWAEFKAAHGWKPLYFQCKLSEPAEGESFPLTVLVRHFSSMAAIAYVPMGPPIPLPADSSTADRRAAILTSLTTALKPYLPAQTLCVRYDAPWETRVSNREDDSGNIGNPGIFPVSPSAPVRQAIQNIQPPDTVLLPLNITEEEILSGMKSKWRYNIRLGEKKGVTVRVFRGEEAVGPALDTFYSLYQETAQRDGIALHSKAYYQDLLTRGSSKEITEGGSQTQVLLYLAEHQSEALAAIIVLYSGEEAVYLYGASSNSKRNLMPAYCLQWRAITDARAAGLLRYDMYGIPPSDDSSHPMHGLYRFKTGFGGLIAHRSGSLDVPLRPVAYELYRLAEWGRTIWFKKVKKLPLKLFRRGNR